MTMLAGRRVLVTRPRTQAAALVDRLAARGATAVLFPTIEIRRVADIAALDAALDRLEQFSWIAFPSANAVQCFFDRTVARRQTLPPGVRIAAVGKMTAQALTDRGAPVHFIPDEFRGARLGTELPDVGGQRVLVPCAARARDEGVAALRRRGAVVETVVVYETHRATPSSAERAGLELGLDAATFTSPSAVEHFFALVGRRARRVLDGVVIACIGPVTADAAHSQGILVQVQPAEYSIAGLVAALEVYFRAPAAGGGGA